MNKKIILKYLLSLSFIFFYAFKLLFYDDLIIDQYFERDLLRAASVFSGFWINSAEIFGGGSTPGYGYNVILYLLHKVSSDDLFLIYSFYLTSVLGSLAFLAIVIFGGFKNNTFFLFMSFSLFTFFPNEFYGSLWNPTFAIPFINLAFAFYFLYFKKNDLKYCILSFFFAFIASTCHLSNWILVSLLLLSTTFMAKSKLKVIQVISIFFILLALLFGPFLISEARIFMNGGQNIWSAIEYDSFRAPWFYLERLFKLLQSFLGIITFSGDVGFQWGYREQFVNSGVIRGVLITTSSLPVLAGIYLNFRRRREIHSLDLYILKFFLFCLFIAFIEYNFAVDSELVNYRRFLWLFPISVIIWTNLAKSLMDSKLGFVILTSFFIGQISYILDCSKRISIDSLKVKKEIMKFSSEKYNYNYRDLVHRLGVFSNNDLMSINNEYFLYSSRGEVNSLFLLKPNNISESDYSFLNRECLFFVLSEGRIGSSLNDFYKFIQSEPEILKYNFDKEKISNIKKSSFGIFFQYPNYRNECPIYFRGFYLNDERRDTKTGALQNYEGGAVRLDVVKMEKKKFLKITVIKNKIISNNIFSTDNSGIRIIFSMEGENIQKKIPFENIFKHSTPRFIDISDINSGKYTIKIPRARLTFEDFIIHP